jgi:glycosyltransferase involved in cell wall biosynthesis
MKSKIAIIAGNIDDPWGGSEELWSRASIRLIECGVSVAASIHERLPLHDRVCALMQSGVKVSLRPESYPLWKRLRRKILSKRKSESLLEVEKFLHAVQPELVVLSQGGVLPSIEFVELCRSKQLPFVTIGQAACEYWWFNDDIAARYREALPAALRCFFVSEANLQLAEKQIGTELPNAEVIRNPFNVNFDCCPTWPSADDGAEMRLACVGRLNLGPKGQDILLEALAGPAWVDRRWWLTFYGNGPMKNIIERLVQRFGLEGRASFGGHVQDIEGIWAQNHVLVMPSRYEGLPLAIVEAMLCGRAVVATNVAGHSEIIEHEVTGFLADAPTVTSMARALERLWDRRHDLRAMGEAAARSIRNKVPRDPAKVFAEKLQGLVVVGERFPDEAIHRVSLSANSSPGMV